MRRAVVRVLLLQLWRDRGALVTGFVLPVVVFVVFAAIFGGASGNRLLLRVVVADELQTPESRRLVAALATLRTVTITARVADRAEAEQQVAGGAADAGLVIRTGARPLDQLAGEGDPPLLVLTHPARSVAGSLLAGNVERLYYERLPDVALRGVVSLVDALVVPLTDEQRTEADRQLADMAPDPAEPDAAPEDGTTMAPLVAQALATTGGASIDEVAYYAGSVAILFVLLAAVHGAASLHDDVASGVVDRVLTGPATLATLVDGRAIFLVGQALLQVTVIFAVAWLGYGVNVPARLGPWLIVTVAVAVASAGLMLLVSVLCRSSQQAIAVSNVAVLVLSAVGGSMVPRFLMPQWLQQLGWLTPNAWAIDAYGEALRTGSALEGSLRPALVLVLLGTGAWLAARHQARRWETR